MYMSYQTFIFFTSHILMSYSKCWTKAFLNRHTLLALHQISMYNIEYGG